MVKASVRPGARRAPTQGVVAAMEQRAFRVLLDCMARPGTVAQLPEPRAADGVWGSALVIMQCLLDHEVTFCVAATDRFPHEQILRRTGARSALLGDAGFVLADAANARLAIERAHEGDLEEPERSATVVICARTVGAGSLRASLTGPGIAEEASLQLDGLDADALQALVERNVPFPTGVDTVFVDPQGRVVCVPRSTRIEVEA